MPKAKLGYLHQGFENLDPRKSVLENVMESSVQTETVPAPSWLGCSSGEMRCTNRWRY